MYLAHPLGVTPCQVVVDGDYVHALARKRVEICGERGYERLAFARTHLCNSALMQAYAADYLHVEVLHLKHSPAGFPEGGKRIEHYVVQRLAVCKSLFKYARLCLELLVAHDGILGF